MTWGPALAPVVAPGHVRGAVLGVVVGHRHGAERAALVVHAGVQVQVPVRIPVAGGERGDLAGPRREARSTRLVQVEGAAAVVPVDHDRVVAGQDQVLVAVVVEVDDQCALGAVHQIQAGELGDVHQGAVVVLEQHAVRQATVLGHEQVVEPVAVHVAHGHTELAGEHVPVHGVRPEVVVLRAEQELGLVARDLGQEVSGDLGEDGRLGLDLHVVEQLDAPQARRGFDGGGGHQLPGEQPLGVHLAEELVLRPADEVRHHARLEATRVAGIHVGAVDLARAVHLPAAARVHLEGRHQLGHQLRQLLGRVQLLGDGPVAAHQHRAVVEDGLEVPWHEHRGAHEVACQVPGDAPERARVTEHLEELLELVLGQVVHRLRAPAGLLRVDPFQGLLDTGRGHLALLAEEHVLGQRALLGLRFRPARRLGLLFLVPALLAQLALAGARGLRAFRGLLLGLVRFLGLRRPGGSCERAGDLLAAAESHGPERHQGQAERGGQGTREERARAGEATRRRCAFGHAWDHGPRRALPRRRRPDPGRGAARPHSIDYTPPAGGL